MSDSDDIGEKPQVVIEKKRKYDGRANLIPYKKGQSGNPSGRPKGFVGRLRDASNDGQIAIDYLIGVINGTEKANARERLEASKLLMAYVGGRPVETTVTVDASASVGGSVQDLSVAELTEMYLTLKNPQQRALPEQSDVVDAEVVEVKTDTTQ